MEVALSPLNFGERARRLYSEREAVVDEDKRFTYGEYLERCDRWSAALQAMGIKRGDRVAYISPNIHSNLESFYAVPQMGGILVPMNYRLQPNDFEYIINHCGARVVCAHPDHFEAVESIRDQLNDVEFFVALEGEHEGWLGYETQLAAHGPGFDRPEIEETDLITINYTSGTTAKPKGVMITHRGAYLNILNTMAHHHLTASDRYLWTLPMFHANGWAFPWINAARGMANVCLRKVEPALIYQLMREERITMFCAAPTVLIGIVNAPDEMKEGVPRGIRLFTAGAPPAPATIEMVERDLGWELTHVYGLTETSPLISFGETWPEHLDLPLQDRAKIKARQGVEMMGSGELRVIDDQGADVPHDAATLGEITVQGNNVMKGYYNNPEATDDAIRDGWFHTGDAAVVHPDGFIEIRDRFKDVIISGGENISSVEVEGCMLEHPSVQEASVVGMPHDKWGESPHAFVILREGATATEDELKLHVRENLAHFKTPQWVSFVDDLPKTATGKVQKYVLRGGQAGIARQ